MNHLLQNLLASLVVLGIGAAPLACEVNVNKDTSGDEDDSSSKKKKKKGDDDDDESKSKKKKKKAEKESDDGEDIDVAALLADSSDASGVLSKTSLENIDTSKAPRLGRKTAESEPGLKDAEWLALPGGALQIPNPSGWLKKKEDNIGLIGSPDKKAFILFTTYQNKDELTKTLDKIGTLLKIKTVDWKKPHEVKLGQDSIPALVRGGDLTTEENEKGSILLALIETGTTDKVVALALAEEDVTKPVKDQALSIILATRKLQ